MNLKDPSSGQFSIDWAYFAQDLRRLAPLWLHKTEEVRADRAHWHLLGDVYGQGWIAEMYGYAFGSSEVRPICLGFLLFLDARRNTYAL
jgi:hypothetical protein